MRWEYFWQYFPPKKSHFSTFLPDTNYFMLLHYTEFSHFYVPSLHKTVSLLLYLSHFSHWNNLWDFVSRSFVWIFISGFFVRWTFLDTAKGKPALKLVLFAVFVWNPKNNFYCHFLTLQLQKIFFWTPSTYVSLWNWDEYR